MNLETEIDRGLWAAVRRSYESAAWSNAILDAIHHLSDTIRSRTGLQSDGTVLAGQALGGKNPKLRLSRLETESETSLQTGVEQLLRGLYQAFRNPRSHGAINDSQSDADAIILLVNHLLKLVGLARTEFTLETCVQRILEENFVPSERYAQLIVGEIPPRRRLDVTLSVYQRKQDTEGKHLRYFFDAVVPTLTPGERADLFAAVSTDLREASADSEIRIILQCINPEFWSEIEEVARLRIEHRLLKDLRDGRYERSSKRCLGGALATWSQSFLSRFTLRDEFYNASLNKLWSTSRDQQDYVFEYFFSSLGSLRDVPDGLFENTVVSGLKGGDDRYYYAISYNRPWKGVVWSDRIQKALIEYEEKRPTIEDDEEVPF